TTVLCCVCGINIHPNPSYRCVPCLRLEYDIAADIPKEVTIYFCRGCGRYLEPPAFWVAAELESKELLSLCLKRLRGLDKVRLVNARFEYTEPHSRRLKLEVTVEKTVNEKVSLEQTFQVEYMVANQFCSDCHRVEAKDYWKAAVQIRQKVDHKRTYYYLEQLMLKSAVTKLATDLKEVPGGLDLFFYTVRDARKLVNFISSSVICKHSHSKKLISHDIKSNIYNYKFTFCVEIAPVCKDSAVCLPKSLARNMGGMSRVCVVQRVAKNILLIDPKTAQTAEVNTLGYFKNPFYDMVTSKHLTKFVVMSVEDSDVKHFAGQGRISRKHTVGDVWVQRESELGSQKQIFCTTHLGYFLHEGDLVLGYDFQNLNLNNCEVDKLAEHELPDVLLVKKYYGNKALRNRMRKWKLRNIKNDDKNSVNRDYMDFLDDLEEDPVLRQQVNVYRRDDHSSFTVAPEDDLDPDAPTISVEEMLEELVEQPLDQSSASPPSAQSGCFDEDDEDDLDWQDALENPD
ncbi:NMD3, partial [Trinorchestia longiramus]